MSIKKVTKNDLVDAIYGATSYDRGMVQTVIESLLVEIKKSLIAGATIELRGFGTFEPRLRKGRSLARNPRTGEKVSVVPHYVAAFRAGKDIKNGLVQLDVKMSQDNSPSSVSEVSE